VEGWEEEERMETTLKKKKNSIQDSVGNEENGYPVPDPHKTMISVTKESSDIHKKTLKEEIWEGISEKFMEKISDMANQNAQDTIYKCIEATLEISLYSLSLSQTSKTHISFLLSLMFSLQQNQRTRG
jgi:hypothetical protein